MPRHAHTSPNAHSNHSDPHAPRELLGAMYRIVSLFAKLADQLLNRRLGLSFAQFRLLMTLECPSRNPKTQKAIARALDITEAAVSRHIRTLVASGFILADRNKHSRRTNDIILTAAGSSITHKALALLDAESSRIFAAVSKRDRVQFSTTLGTVIRRLAHFYPDIIAHEHAPPAPHHSVDSHDTI